MTKLVMWHYPAISKNFNQQPGAVLFVVLSCLCVTGASAQEESEACPCFSSEEVESVFQRADQIVIGEGEIMCKAEDYSVELNAEITILDKDYALSAQASVEWMDYDPGLCTYIDKQLDPAVERNVRWPHPAPEGTARACYDIISSVIKQSDSSGKCITM